MYALETANAYPSRETDSGPTVTYTNNPGDVARRNTHDNFNLQYKDFYDERTVNHALNKRLYDILGHYALDVHNEATEIGNPTFLQVYKLATDEWG